MNKFLILKMKHYTYTERVYKRQETLQDVRHVSCQSRGQNIKTSKV